MCGICGQLRFDHQTVNSQTIKSMMSKIERRGPDDSGSWINGPIGFGHQRLSIIDLSKNGSQPMIDRELDLTLVFNGTIYNYQVLRSELIKKGYRFFSESDSEVILKSYHLWGQDCVKRFDGMFAFAIWDSSKSQLFLARDRMGIKPLYIHQDNHSISFGSNTQSLLSTGIEKSISEIGLQYQLSLHAVIPAPNTIIKGITKMPPGSTLIINQEGQSKSRQYWYPNASRINDYSDQDYLDKTEYLLKEAVKKRMGASDVPIGVLLSGGLDSSLLVALLAESGHANVRTFSIGFEDIDDEAGSEFEYSDQVVSQYKTTHSKYIVPNNSVLPRLEEAVDNMAEPMVGQDAVAFYLLSEQVSKDVKVVLSGQGADEAFAGYFWYPRMQSEITGSEYDRFAKHYIDRPYNEFLETVTSKFQVRNYTKDWVNEEFSRAGAETFLDKVLRMDITSLIVDDPVKRVDNMTMAWGLEARVPFMDYQLVEHALSTPEHLKLKEEGKGPLKYLARGRIPDSIIDRKKGYFPMPALKYVQGDFLTFMSDILNSTACVNRGIFDRKYVKKLIDNPRDYMTALNGSRLWHLALLEFWLQRNVD